MDVGDGGAGLRRIVALRTTAFSHLREILNIMPFESRLFGTVPEKPGFTPMALLANEEDRSHLRRSNPVIAVTIVAGGRRKIIFDQQGIGMNAPLPQFVLVYRQRRAVGEFITAHALGIRVALAAGFGYRGAIHARKTICRRADVVDAMAIDTRRAVGITGLQDFAMLADQVLRQLIHTGARLEAPHVVRIGMATTAKFRNRSKFRRAVKGIGFILLVHGGRHIVRQFGIGIPPVAILARQAEGAVDVRRQKFLHHPHVITVLDGLEIPMAFDAGSFLSS